jgi:K+-transporting ATPase ATPase C chain
LAANWAKEDPAAGEYVQAWAEDPHQPEVLGGWRNDHPEVAENPKPEDLATYFFASFARANPGKWPVVQDKKVTLVSNGQEIQARFFDLWLQFHLGVKLKKVPADMVMASGSGLDPHVTYRNALYQAPFVAHERGRTRKEIEELIERLAERPIGGLPIGGEERIVNVLELNLALDRLPKP